MFNTRGRGGQRPFEQWMDGWMDGHFGLVNVKKKCIIGIGRLPLNAKADGTEERPAISCEILEKFVVHKSMSTDRSVLIILGKL